MSQENTGKRCQVKVGMFVQKECGNPAIERCHECGVNMCRKHTKKQGEHLLCVECYAKTEEAQQNKDRMYNDWEDGTLSGSGYNLWYFATRDQFYRQHRYRAFDEHDYHDFEMSDTADLDFDDDADTGGLFDS